MHVDRGSCVQSQHGDSLTHPAHTYLIEEAVTDDVVSIDQQCHIARVDELYARVIAASSDVAAVDDEMR